MLRLTRLKRAIVLVFVCVCNAAIGQQIQYLSIDNGLSNNSVNTIFQDHYGFMWFGTYDGLNRYDGYNFKIFKNHWGDEKSLINNHVNCIVEDKENRIWAGTEKGLVYYNYTDSKIYTVYYQPFNQSKPKKVTSRINSMTTDTAGNVYIATEDLGLLIYDNGSTVCRQVGYAGYFAQNVHNLVLDKQGRIWLFISNVGLCRYDKALRSISLINKQLTQISCFTPDANDANIWIGTERGLYKYNIEHNEVIAQTYRLTNRNIMHLYLDNKNQIWAATDGGGIDIINTESNKISYILPGEQKGSLSSGSVYYIYEDRDARKWIATLRGGINIIDLKNHQFKSITHDPLNKNSLVNNFTRSFCEDAEGNIWIGTAGGGLSFWNTALNSYTNYTHNEADPNSLSSDFVMSIFSDDKNNIWIATFNGGINRFDKQTHTFKHYTCMNTYTQGEDRNAWKLFEDKHHNLWAATTRGGALYTFNYAADKFELFDHRLTSINCFFEDETGTLWAGTNSQLIKIDLKKKEHQVIPLNSVIFSIHQDRFKNFWIGTDVGGLLLFNRKTGTFTRYTEADGLPSNTILDILEDNTGSIWLSSFNGISRFNPLTKTFKNYYASDGLQSNQFNFGAALKLRSGEFLFGGIKGFNRFNPDSIKTNTSIPKIFVTGFKVNDIPLELDAAYTGKSAINLDHITLPYDKAVISIDFVALEYSFPDKISYSYYLEGWDHAWNNSGKIKTANYSRLNEGSYVLRIKSTNSDGFWSNNQRLIYITVLPPWQRTWLAYVLYALAITGIVYWFWLYRSRQTKLKYEVQIANLKVEREKELNEKKLSFFTNISHEFRTPLTLIINPIKDLLNQNKGDTQELNTIYRNAKRLLGLVDHLLLFRKAESENNQLKITKENFINLCDDVFICFKHQVKIKKLDYTIEKSADDIEVYVDREKIEIALFNLISNAIKFTPDGGSIHLIVKDGEGHVYFEIADNGIGISTDVGDKLFSKFYQVKDKNYFKTGFGIGLYLVKVFIDSHKGTISYKNTEGGGTTFVLSLPKGKKHFTADQLFEEIPGEATYVNDFIDHDSKDIALHEEETNDLELLISNKPTILVIDDNDQIRGYIKKIFITDYIILEAVDGKEGLERIRKHLPDIIISDIVMNGLDGLELCRIVKQDSAISHIPIILLTGDATPDIMLKSIDGGAVDFLRKPFEKEILIARVKSVLRSKLELQNYFYSEITLKNSSRNISEEHKDFVYNCITVIEHYMMDPDFDVQTIAQEMATSYPTLYKKIKSITGQSVNNFVRFVRLRKAAELLIHTNGNVNEVAFQVGFNDLKYFREHFNKQFGMNPSEFIRKHRAAFQISYRISSKKVLN